MAGIVEDCDFGFCKTGITAPSDPDTIVRGSRFTGCETGIEWRDPPSLLASLGLRADAPRHALRELLEFAEKNQGQGSSLADKARRVGLLDYLAAGANVATLVNSILQLSESQLAQALRVLFP